MVHRPNRKTIDPLPRRRFVLGSAALLGSGFVPATLPASLKADESSHPLERVTFQTEKNQRIEEGRVILEAQDGGVILEGRDGRLWTILPDDLEERSQVDGMKFVPYSTRQLSDRMKLEFGTGYACWEYGPLVICTNAGKTYADWCGQLFVRLHQSFEIEDNLPNTH